MTVETPCKEWEGSRRGPGQGYGVKRHQGVSYPVHRLVVAQEVGWEAIRGKQVMHLCDNPLCYRLDHLRIGTHADNMKDRNEKGRQAKGERNHKAKLTEEQVLEIRKSSDRNIDLARSFGVTPSVISKIKNRKTWTHV